MTESAGRIYLPPLVDWFDILDNFTSEKWSEVGDRIQMYTSNRICILKTATAADTATTATTTQGSRILLRAIHMKNPPDA